MFLFVFNHSKVVLLLWIICVIYVLCLSCFHICSLLPCGHLPGKGLALVCDVYRVFVTFPFVCLFDLILYVHSTIFQLCGTVLPGLNQY